MVKYTKHMYNCFVWCEIWSMTVKEESAARVFGPKKEITEQCRKLYNDELHNLYSLHTINK